MNEMKQTRGDIADRSYSDCRITGSGSLIVVTRKLDPVHILLESYNPEMPQVLASSS
jgi:uncharacterized secreted protein with C-terminal beta-propeller domain